MRTDAASFFRQDAFVFPKFRIIFLYAASLYAYTIAEVMNVNMRTWLQAQRELRAKKALPVLSFPSISLLGITVRELIGSAALQAEGMKRIADRVDTAASVSMMDLSVEAEAFGSTIRFSDDEVPTVLGALTHDLDEARALAVPKVGAGRTGRYIEAIGRACQAIDDRPVLAGVIGPFSLAGRLMDVTEALVNCLTEPEMVHVIMRKATDFLIDYICAYKAIGAHGVVIAEPLTGLLSPALADEFSAPYVREIARAVRSEDFLVMYHNCGNNTILMADSILSTECDCYHFGNSIRMLDMLEKMPRDTVVLGNVDPAGQFRNGTPQSIREETLRIMTECCPEYPNFIISSGCDIPPQSGWENIDAFFAAVSAYYAGESR